MKTKIIFMIINMNIGGTEKALLNMLNEIDYDKYEITVLMLEEYGEFLKYIPNCVKVKYLNYYNDIQEKINKPPHVVSIDLLKRGKLLDSLLIILLHMISKIIKDRTIFFKYILKNYVDIDEYYDLAVAYSGPMDFISYFVCNKINANKKVQWIHFDVTKINFNKHFADKIYNKFDKVFVVSNEAKEKLNKLIPNLTSKTEVFNNILSKQSIKHMADKESGFNDYFEGIRILTVGRLSKEKGQDLTIPVLAKLKANGYNVRWYCIGEGNSRQYYEQIIEQYNVKQDYILMGSTANPYPFMKECDIYVQPSRHEGYCITIAEVKYFNKPIVSTNFTGAKEQLGEQGYIVQFDESEMYNSIKNIIENSKNKKISDMQYEEIESSKEINKLYKVLL